MTTTEEIKARSALAMIVGIARAHRERAAMGIADGEDILIDALTRIEDYGYQAMPWLRDNE